MKIKCATITRKNRDPQKPNEDAAGVDCERGIFAVADGITRGTRPDGNYPLPSASVYAAQTLASAVIGTLREHAYLPLATIESAIRAAYEAANKQIALYAATLPPVNYYDDDFPATVGTVLVLHDQYAVWGHLGDSLLVRLGADGKQGLLSRDQTAPYGAWAHAHGSANWNTIESWLRSRRDARNKPGFTAAYGALTGEVAALGFIETGKVECAPGDIFALLSDGFYGLWIAENIDMRERERIPTIVAKLLQAGRLEELVEAAEATDERLGLRSDDKTTVLVEIGVV